MGALLVSSAIDRLEAGRFSDQQIALPVPGIDPRRILGDDVNAFAP
jgi:hypothetical protein